eukprot:CAMPEP_0174347452 /NCGR_PEP_ID=MMETSP0811_2-20130205/3543_1 /TAXON_ID=73025 ORGANISM="Eutreptiella gymnastica-like, Strain CCMP1594" /NCGR_SAMPLE_ID=MMETSP0811_2 /ASSEMBLY_ACC=CAM_ASM_000667 /LENGTH=174 /DNA_ID=CAMNT_0015473031 /DNA_START=287 /DNA_END=812 /DNA_ORIENTATION=+
MSARSRGGACLLRTLLHRCAVLHSHADQHSPTRQWRPHRVLAQAVHVAGRACPASACTSTGTVPENDALWQCKDKGVRVCLQTLGPDWDLVTVARLGKSQKASDVQKWPRNTKKAGGPMAPKGSPKTIAMFLLSSDDTRRRGLVARVGGSNRELVQASATVDTNQQVSTNVTKC